MFVRDDLAALLGLKTRGGGFQQRVRGSTEGHDNAIHRNIEFAALNDDRAASAGSVRLAKLHFYASNTGDPAVIRVTRVGDVRRQNLYRVRQRVEDDALFLCVLHFFLTCRQFCHAAAVDDVHVLRAETLCGSRSVHGHVTAADDRHVFRVLDRRSGIIAVSLHQVAAGEEFVCGVHTLQVLARDVHKAGKTCTRADKHGLVAVLVLQLFNRQDTTDNHIGLHLDAERLEVIDFLLHDGLRQTKLRDAVHEHAACKVQRFVNRHVVAQLCEVARAGKTRRAGTDNGNFVAVLRRGDGGNGSVCVVPVGNKTLQTADADRFALNAAHALAFALRLLRADTAADSRQGRGLRNNLIRALKVVLGDLFDEFRNMNIDRAAGNARHVLTIQAALCFVQRHFFGIAQCDLFKVLVANVRVLRGHGVLCHSHVRHDHSTSFLNRLQASS